MNNRSSGLLGIGGLIAGVVVLLAARRYFPALANLLLILIGICVFLVLLLVAVVIYFAFAKPKKTEEQKAADEVQAILKTAKQHLMGLRRMSMEIKNAKVRTLSTEVSSSIDKILRILNEKPEQVGSLRQFFHYYLPTTEKIMVKYKELESSGVPTMEVTENTIDCLKNIKAAMEKQYNNLFESDILDLTVEMEVLTQICKRDGLLTDEDFQLEKTNIEG
ncbi:MAG: 5-bromo-4-chloroindolyl phosphate hydrolysis family protein [Lachnospiraceae bacterium]|nr:5-bromo-4-chloroindolyl phosphate hydrolysis family protein [Lachnospiraceae bacterium]